MNPLFVARAIHEWSPLNLMPLITLSNDDELLYIIFYLFFVFIFKCKLLLTFINFLSFFKKVKNLKKIFYSNLINYIQKFIKIEFINIKKQSIFSFQELYRIFLSLYVGWLRMLNLFLCRPQMPQSVVIIHP